MYVRTREPAHATRTRRASASPGAAILPDRRAIERLSDNQNECLGSASGRGRARIWENFLPADRHARGRPERRRETAGVMEISSGSNSHTHLETQEQKIAAFIIRDNSYEAASEQRRQKSREHGATRPAVRFLHPRARLADFSFQRRFHRPITGDRGPIVY